MHSEEMFDGMRSVKRMTLRLSAALCLALLLAGCGDSAVRESAPTAAPAAVTAAPEEAADTPAAEAEEAKTPTEEEETKMLQMKIGDTAVAVEWEENESVQALRELCRNEPLEISLSMYGGFEQVGPIGTSLPRSDVQTTTQSGDIVLYAGDQLVVFYGSNSWAYTRLGHITDQSAADMAALLGGGDVTVTLYEGAEG